MPIAVKDIIRTDEGPTTAQSLILDPHWGDAGDAPVVARLRAAGAVITGKTTTMEFACGCPDPEKPFPIPRNPLGSEHVARRIQLGDRQRCRRRVVLRRFGHRHGRKYSLPCFVLRDQRSQADVRTGAEVGMHASRLLVRSHRTDGPQRPRLRIDARGHGRT